MECVLQRTDQYLASIVVRYFALFNERYRRHERLDGAHKLTWKYKQTDIALIKIYPDIASLFQ